MPCSARLYKTYSTCHVSRVSVQSIRTITAPSSPARAFRARRGVEAPPHLASSVRAGVSHARPLSVKAASQESSVGRMAWVPKSGAYVPLAPAAPEVAIARLALEPRVVQAS